MQRGTYRIRIAVECPDERTEVLPESLETTALAVEELVSLLLLELFGSVSVNSVVITYVPCRELGGGAAGPAA